MSVKKNCNLIISRNFCYYYHHYNFYRLAWWTKQKLVSCTDPKKRQEQKQWSFSWDTGSSWRIWASAKSSQNQRQESWKKGKIWYKEEDLTPSSSFWHHRHTESMTHDFFHFVMGVGGLIWFPPHLLLIYHLPPTFKIQNCQNSDFLFWQHCLAPPSFHLNMLGLPGFALIPNQIRRYLHKDCSSYEHALRLSRFFSTAQLFPHFLPQNKTKLIRQMQAWFHSFISAFIHT